MRLRSLEVVAKLTIVRNPANDRDFQRILEQLVDSGVRDPLEVERRLRERYPRAVVRPRDLAGESTSTWYVYRDGHWTAGD